MSDFFMILERGAYTQEDKVALKDPQYKLTYGELWKTLKLYRRAVSVRGVKRGMIVCLMLESNLDWVVSFLVLISLGVRVIPIAPHVSAAELALMERQLKLDFQIDREWWMSLTTDVMPSGESEPIWVTEADEVLLQPTSGSTGIPKYCVRTFGSLRAEGMSYRETLSLGTEDVILNTLPLRHSYALGMVLMGGLVSGASLILLPRFLPREYIRRLQQEKVTVAPLVPVMAHYLVHLFQTEQVQLPDLRVLLVGAGKISKYTFQAFYQRYGIWLSSNYGSTETGGVVSRLEPGFYPGVGQAMADNRLEIRDDEGHVLPPYTEGHIWIQTLGKLKRYWGEEMEFAQDAFFPMGDLGYLDKDGVLFLTGRIKSMINVGGKKVNPSHVEEILIQHPQVIDAAVVGVPRSSGEEMVKAVMVVEGEVTSAEIRTYTRLHLADYEQPTLISFVRTLPKDELGKLKRGALISI